MYKLPTPNTSHRWNHLCLVKVAADYRVHGYLPDNTSKGRYVCSQFTTLSRYFNESLEEEKIIGPLLLKGFVEIDDAYWGDKRHGGKRGRGTPGKTPFLAAISPNEEGRPIHMRMSKLPSITSANVEAWSRKHLGQQSIFISDTYHTFNCLSRLVAVHGQLKASRIYDDPQNKIFHGVNTMIGNVKKGDTRDVPFGKL